MITRSAQMSASLQRSPIGGETRKPPAEAVVLSPPLPLPRANEHAKASNGDAARNNLGTGIEVRISSLKVLSLTLLAEVESLERQAADGNVSDDFDLQAEVRRFEAELIRNALVRTGGRQRRAARLLGMKVTTLNTKIRRYKITLD